MLTVKSSFRNCIVLLMLFSVLFAACGATSPGGGSTSTSGTTPINPMVSGGPQSPTGATGKWSLAADALNESIWYSCFPYSGGDCHTDGNGQKAIFQDAQVTTVNGSLQITAQSGTSSEGSFSSNVTSGLIQTGGPVGSNPNPTSYALSVKPGSFIEAKISVAHGAQYFPAFWLLGATSEIDIMEIFGTTPGQSCGLWSNHYKSHWPCPSHGDSKNIHTYGVNWQKNSITFYMDGHPVGSTTQFVPTESMYIILDFAYAPNFMKNQGQGNLPAVMNISYVKVWTHN